VKKEGGRISLSGEEEEIGEEREGGEGSGDGIVSGAA
jgi:hypothetical protein